MVRTRWLSFPNGLALATAAGLAGIASGVLTLTTAGNSAPERLTAQASAAAMAEPDAANRVPARVALELPQDQGPTAPQDVAAPVPVAASEPLTAPREQISGSVSPLAVWQAAVAPPRERVTAPQEQIGGSVSPLAVWEPAVAPPVVPVSAPRVEAPVHVAALEPKPLIEKVVAKPVPVPPTQQPRSREPTLAPLLGTWVPHAQACADPDGSEYLPLLITQAKASAGEGTCNFLSKKPEGGRWRVVAECSDGQSTWTSNVDLGVSQGRLTWASERGTQFYVRCQPTVVAKAATKQRVAAHRSAKKVARAAAPKRSGVRVTTGPGGSSGPGWAVLRVR